MGLSIFLDAQCVAGDATLLDACRTFLLDHFEGRSDILAHLAKVTLAFETSLSLFFRFCFGKSGA